MSHASHRILIAEDDRVIARVLSRHLEREGFIVEVTHCGGDALAAFDRNDFDFLLADYQMPDMTGEALCRHIRSDRRYAQLPMALCTAKAHEVDMAGLTAELRLSHIFLKPFSLREIVIAIRETIDAASVPMEWQSG